MDATNKPGAGQASGFEFIISRVFDAPRELMWKMWTDPAHIARWWGPKGSTVKHCDMDLRLGGMCHYRLDFPPGEDMWGRLVYREIEPPSKLVFIVSFSDPNRGVTVHPMNPDWPSEVLSTVTFAARGEKTEVTIRWQAFNATDLERKTFEEGRDSMRQGWTGSLDQLEAHLAEV